MDFIWQKNSPFPEPFPPGAVLLIDKPIAWTSFDVVNKIRYRFSKKVGNKKLKVGHAGTLDPLATGLLMLCVGDYTKKIDQIQAQEKEYTGVITFGATTASYDLEKAVVPHPAGIKGLNNDLLQAAQTRFVGLIRQVPPMFSAVKIDGKRMYQDARTGKAVDIEPRAVEITAFEIGPLRPAKTQTEIPVILSERGAAIWQHPDFREGLQADFRVVCSKGTYIRSLVFDLGEALGCGAYLSALRRTRNGLFCIEDAWQLDDLLDAVILAE